MPIVTIESWPLDKEKKPEIISGITDVFAGVGIPKDAVTVVIHENPLDNWGTAGQQHTVKYKDIGGLRKDLNKEQD